MPVRKVLLLMPVATRRQDLPGRSDVLRTLPQRLRLQVFRINHNCVQRQHGVGGLCLSSSEDTMAGEQTPRDASLESHLAERLLAYRIPLGAHWTR